MKEYYLYVQETAKIIDAIPESKKYIRQTNAFTNCEHINEFGRMTFGKIHPESLKMHQNKGIEISYIDKGKYNWEVEGKKYTLLPGDSFVTCPWETHGSPTEFIDPGIFNWIIINPENFTENSKLVLGDWSGLSSDEQEELGEMLKNKTHHIFKDSETKKILLAISEEIETASFAYTSRVNALIDELLIRCARNIKEGLYRDKVKPVFMKELDEKIRNSISNSWTVTEMCDLLEIGATNLTQKIKMATGLTPVNYVISLRIEKAKDLLESESNSISSIAWDCGFNSPQHFSNTFKKLTGITPKEYRNNRL